MTKKKLTVALLLTLIFLLNATIPAFADDYNDPGQINVTIDGNGKLTITGGGFSDNKEQAWRQFINKYRNFITGVAGVAAITMIVLFIIQFIKLGASADNPTARAHALQGCLWTGIAAAGLGAVTFIVGFFYNVIR